MYTRNPASALCGPCHAGRHLASPCAPAEGVSVWVWGAQGTGNPGVAVGPRKWPTKMLNYMQKVQHERVWERHGCAARGSCSSSGCTVLQAPRIPNITRQTLSYSFALKLLILISNLQA